MKKRSFTIRVGPLGLSLAAAAITAVAFAAISVADNGGGGSDGGATQTFQGPPPPGGGVGITTFRAELNLSDADRQKGEEFKQCLLDNDAPKPPDPGEIDPSNPPKPPREADLENLNKAWEACKDKLPEDLQKAGPPQLQFGGDCAAPPGAPGEQGKQQNQDQSNDSSTSSSGSSS